LTTWAHNKDDSPSALGQRRVEDVLEEQALDQLICASLKAWRRVHKLTFFLRAVPDLEVEGQQTISQLYHTKSK
jgi:hypothetical protein